MISLLRKTRRRRRSVRKVSSLIVPLFLLWSLTAIASAAPPIEPEDEYLVNEEVNSIAGLYFREYSLMQNGVIDYKTARQIIVSEYNEFWNTVVHTKEHPLFYWYDENQDGHMYMWVDQKVEGCSCDIILYEATYSENAQ
ncbi:MAG: hypothetical protein NPIRA01_15000 [Nitrospirales bacterium]|nr:MAG: hypothetical protein NPIRA01_15000 [Nitrospirales bacterium]